MENFNTSILNRLLGKEFTLESAANEKPLSAKLSQVEGARCHGDEWEAFTAIFVLNEGQESLVAEGEYIIKNSEIGEVTLFGSPNSSTEIEFCCSFAKGE